MLHYTSVHFAGAGPKIKGNLMRHTTPPRSYHHKGTGRDSSREGRKFCVQSGEYPFCGGYLVPTPACTSVGGG